MGVSVEGLEELLASGKINADTDVTEIAELLAGGGASKSAKDAGATDETVDDDDAEADKAAKAKADADAAAKAAADAAAAAAADVKPGGDKSSAPAQQVEPEGPIATESGNGTIPYAVLKGTRERLAEAQENLRRNKAESEERISTLEQQLAARTAPTRATADSVQDVADRAGITDAAGNKVDVTKIDVTSLRGEFPDAVVNIIESLQQALVAHETTISTLQKREQGRVQQEQLSEEELLQKDIDAVPQLAIWAADKDPKMFDRAVRFDNALLADPEWKGKPRVERYAEVVRLIGGETPKPAASTTTTAKPTQTPAQVRTVSAELQRAAARAAPTSLSDLPAGSPAAQSETEAIEGMDALAIAAKMQDMTPAQQEAFLARFA